MEYPCIRSSTAKWAELIDALTKYQVHPTIPNNVVQTQWFSHVKPFSPCNVHWLTSNVFTKKKLEYCWVSKMNEMFDWRWVEIECINSFNITASSINNLWNPFWVCICNRLWKNRNSLKASQGPSNFRLSIRFHSSTPKSITFNICLSFDFLFEFSMNANPRVSKRTDYSVEIFLNILDLYSEKEKLDDELWDSIPREPRKTPIIVCSVHASRPF